MAVSLEKKEWPEGFLLDCVVHLHPCILQEDNFLNKNETNNDWVEKKHQEKIASSKTWSKPF